jgi:hypothetical protein
MGWPPRANIERTDRMLMFMGPVNWCNMLSTDAWLSLLLQWLCWERNWVANLWTTQSDWGLCREPFFSGAVGSVQHCWWLLKGCHVCGLPVESVRGAYVDWRENDTCHVYRVFPYRMYIDSNHRDSRIRATACSWQSSRSKLIEYCLLMNYVYTWL